MVNVDFDRSFSAYGQPTRGGCASQKLIGFLIMSLAGSLASMPYAFFENGIFNALIWCDKLARRTSYACFPRALAAGRLRWKMLGKRQGFHKG
jgi:hypothetical protein